MGLVHVILLTQTEGQSGETEEIQDGFKFVVIAKNLRKEGGKQYSVYYTSHIQLSFCKYSMKSINFKLKRWETVRFMACDLLETACIVQDFFLDSGYQTEIMYQCYFKRITQNNTAMSVYKRL